MWPNEVESGVASRRRDLMPRVNQTRPAGSISATAPDAFGPRQQLVSLLAQSAGPSDLLPRLHHHALEATGGVCSLLFRYNPRNGLLHATSGFGLDALGSEPWTPDKDEAALIANAFDTAAPVFVADADRLMPDLSSRLGTPATLLLPLVRRSAKVGLLAIGFTESHSRPPADTAGLPDAFVASLELFELRQRESGTGLDSEKRGGARP